MPQKHWLSSGSDSLLSGQAQLQRALDSKIKRAFITKKNGGQWYTSQIYENTQIIVLTCGDEFISTSK